MFTVMRLGLTAAVLLILLFIQVVSVPLAIVGGVTIIIAHLKLVRYTLTRTGNFSSQFLADMLLTVFTNVIILFHGVIFLQEYTEGNETAIVELFELGGVAHYLFGIILFSMTIGPGLLSNICFRHIRKNSPIILKSTVDSIVFETLTTLSNIDLGTEKSDICTVVAVMSDSKITCIKIDSKSDIDNIFEKQDVSQSCSYCSENSACYSATTLNLDTGKTEKEIIFCESCIYELLKPAIHETGLSKTQVAARTI